MQKTVYYLVDLTNCQRTQWYETLAGARIAQRSRNRRLGFIERVERIELTDNLEVEQCLVDDEIVTATLAIQEDTVEQVDLD